MSLLDLPTATDFPKALQQVVPQEDRDFSRPKEPFWPENYPKYIDSNYADTIINLPDVELKSQNSSSNFIELVQKFMAKNPLGPPYTGPINGQLNSELLNVVKFFQSAVSAKYNKKFNIVSGSSINQAEMTKAIQALKGIKEIPVDSKDSSAITPEIQGSDLIKAYQNFFASAGAYTGPKDGVISQSLISAAKQIEQVIAAKINNKSVIGMIWSNSAKSFVTSPQEVKEVLSLLSSKSS
jgi:hypothetical protein